jgi:Ca2+-binding EF-hand superfamily protein
MTRNFLITLTSLSLSLTWTTANARPAINAPTVASILGDANADCVVNVNDLRIVIGANGTNLMTADHNGDGAVDTLDASIVSIELGATCSDRLLGDVNGDGLVSASDIRQALAMANTNHPAADIDNDGDVTATDFALIEANFGASAASRVLGDADASGVVTTADLQTALAQLGRAGSADCDGDGVVTISDISMVQARMGATTSTTLPGDINGDRVVDVADQSLLEAHFGTDWARADIDGDGIVSVTDLMELLSVMSDTTAQILLGDINGDGTVGSVDQEMMEALFSSDDAVADIDGDGLVATSDFMVLLENIGLVYADNLEGDVDGNCIVGSEDLALVEASLGSDWIQGDVNGDAQVTIADTLLILGHLGDTCE